MKQYRIAVLPGDGIGPEISRQATAVLRAVADRFSFKLELDEADIGGSAIDRCGNPLPHETVACCQASDAVLLGAVGGPQWDGLEPGVRPEAGLLGIRSALGLFANLRPARLYPALRAASPLKDEIVGESLDLLIVRELTGGIYYGEKGRIKEGTISAYDTERYSETEIARILHLAFRMAGSRNGRLCSVDKANVLESSRLWRETALRVSAAYPDVELSHMYIDNAAMQLIKAPRQFDTLVTSNLFGDILSDEASQITGSIGMLPSASVNESGFGLYEPIHGSAPELAGKDIANPLAAILSVSMLLRHSLGEDEAAEAIEQAVSTVLDRGLRTADLALKHEPVVGTAHMGEAIVSAIR